MLTKSTQLHFKGICEHLKNLTKRQVKVTIYKRYIITFTNCKNLVFHKFSRGKCGKVGFLLILTAQTVEKSVENVENGFKSGKNKVENPEDIPPKFWEG